MDRTIGRVSEGIDSLEQRLELSRCSARPHDLIPARGTAPCVFATSDDEMFHCWMGVAIAKNLGDRRQASID